MGHGEESESRPSESGITSSDVRVFKLQYPGSMAVSSRGGGVGSPDCSEISSMLSGMVSYIPSSIVKGFAGISTNSVCFRDTFIGAVRIEATGAGLSFMHCALDISSSESVVSRR